MIDGYRVRVVNALTEAETILNTDLLTSVTVDRLDCCADYYFSVAAMTIGVGTQSAERTFRTSPDLSGTWVHVSGTWVHVYGTWVHVSGTCVNMFLVHVWICFWYMCGYVSGTCVDMFLVHVWICFWYMCGYVSGTCVDMFLVHVWICFWYMCGYVSGTSGGCFMTIVPWDIINYSQHLSTYLCLHHNDILHFFPDRIVITATPVNTSAISISWTVPVSIQNQGFESVVVSVQSECITGESISQPQVFTLNGGSSGNVVATGLGNLV